MRASSTYHAFDGTAYERFLDREIIMTLLGKRSLFANITFLQAVATACVTTALAPASPADAATCNIAIAANFTQPAREITQIFESKTGHNVMLSFGATGQFYAQMTQAAPFDAFLSADESTPKRLVSDGLAVADSLFTYAVGKLVLFSGQTGLVIGEQILRDPKFTNIAIANPRTAPYGAAAVETMKALGVYDALSDKIVQGNDIAQTFQFVDTGNAELGFVALSQVIKRPGGSRWVVPANLYRPIRQDAVLLRRGAGNAAAKAFLAFLKGPEANAVIEKFGYAVK
jgi:molybdate transport system substrate-binding protein